MRPLFLAVLCLAPPLRASVLEFAVDVDGRAVGSHRFEVSTGVEGALEVRSEARFSYRLLGVTLYRYHHDAEERWQGGCVQFLQSATDDNGRSYGVRAGRRDANLEVSVGTAVRQEPGCVRTFAYWDPQMLAGGRLLNPQTGESQAVVFEELGNGPLRLPGGSTVTARRLRLTGEGLRIELWYGTAGEWLQLESQTPEGRLLRYRRIQ